MSNCYHILIFMLLLLFLFLLHPSTQTPPPTFPTTHPNHRLQRRQHGSRLSSCDSFSGKQQRSLCFQLQGVHSFRPSYTPPSQLNEIDPRYGVEKRLIPSGPNPLHN